MSSHCSAAKHSATHSSGKATPSGTHASLLGAIPLRLTAHGPQHMRTRTHTHHTAPAQDSTLLCPRGLPICGSRCPSLTPARHYAKVHTSPATRITHTSAARRNRSRVLRKKQTAPPACIPQAPEPAVLCPVSTLLAQTRRWQLH
jgi:hypothetical protein